MGLQPICSGIFTFACAHAFGQALWNLFRARLFFHFRSHSSCPPSAFARLSRLPPATTSHSHDASPALAQGFALSLSPSRAPSLGPQPVSNICPPLPPAFRSGAGDHARSSRHCTAPQAPHELGPTQVSGSVLLVVRVEHDASNAPQCDHVTAFAPPCSSPFLVTMLIFPLRWFSSAVWCSFRRDSARRVCATSLLVSRSHSSIGPYLVLCFSLAPGGSRVGKV